MNPALALLFGIVCGLPIGWMVGKAVGQRNAISNLRKDREAKRREMDRLDQILGNSSPTRVRSAVVKPTASRRSQAELDDDSR